MNRVLKIIDVLDYYDGPELLVAEDQFGSLHLVNFAGDESGPDREIFISTLISKERLAALRSGEFPVCEIFNQPEIDEFFKMALNGKEESVVAEKIDRIEESWIPPESYFVELPDQENAEQEEVDRRGATEVLGS